MEEEFDIDGIVSEQLKNKWWAKRKLIKLLKKQIIIADNSIKQSAHVLKAIIEEKNDLLKKREKESNPVVLETYNSLYSVQCDMERLFNFIGFIAINSIDIFILNRQFLKDSDIRSRHFYARYACMLMYEMTEDVTQLLGNDKDVVTGKLFGIRNMVEGLRNNELTNELNNTARAWNNFKNTISRDGRNFSHIRNTSVAHRDHEFLKQYNTVTTLSWGSVFSDIIEFNTIINILQIFVRMFLQQFSTIYMQKYVVDMKRSFDIFDDYLRHN